MVEITYICSRNIVHMTKRILKYTFALTLSLAVPAVVIASEMAKQEMSAEPTEVIISVQQSSAIVTGAVGQSLEVVSLTGKCLMTVRIDSPSQRIELNVPKGCYILKVGKVVRKVTVR